MLRDGFAECCPGADKISPHGTQLKLSFLTAADFQHLHPEARAPLIICIQSSNEIVLCVVNQSDTEIFAGSLEFTVNSAVMLQSESGTGFKRRKIFRLPALLRPPAECAITKRCPRSTTKLLGLGLCYPIGPDEEDTAWADGIDVTLARDPPIDVTSEGSTGNGTAE